MTSTCTTMPLTADLLRGAIEVERTDTGLLPHRLPGWARAQARDAQLSLAAAQPSGVRLALRTTASAIELDTLPTRRAYVGAPPRPDGIYDLTVDGTLVAQRTAGGGATLVIDPTNGSSRLEPGPTATLRFEHLPVHDKVVEIWLPHNETTELIALRADAPVAPAPASGRRVWLHHGSSISHGSDAASPTTTWPATAASIAGVDLVNLGLGGGALLDPFTARVMRDTPADLISCKLGINVVNHDLMRLRAFTPAVHGFLDTIREGHPETPLVVVSPILCPIHEHTPGPSGPDLAELGEGRMRFRALGDPQDTASGRLTLSVIRDELARIVAERSADDPHLHHLDGRALYGEADAAALPLPDDLHPDAATHRLMGERFAELALTGAGALAGARG
ncbi:GDSL-type esterase/lipase family protein [Nocardioides sp. MAHUQ-72]|uniref:GDSL-type esterase/lipase family protein n=1 Tax=unclassified Nocardioides TaxID=2615069 RepID=UPI00361F09F9